MTDMATTVHDVAAAVVERHHPIDQLKLQKIVFFAAGEFAALTGSQMFPEPIEAWDYGPVIYDVWNTYRQYDGHAAIISPERGDATKLNSLEIGCIEAALEKYGERSGADLIDVTHKEVAWKESYVPGQLRTEIPIELMISSFRAKYENLELPGDLLDRLFTSSGRG
jgi:uncharacterized phage-associated protein